MPNLKSLLCSVWAVRGGGGYEKVIEHLLTCICSIQNSNSECGILVRVMLRDGSRARAKT